MSDPVAQITPIGAIAGTNTGLPNGDMPALQQIATTDPVGPVAANRQPSALEKRTVTLHTKVSELITNNNRIDETYLRRDGSTQQTGGEGMTADMPMNNFTLTGLRIAAADDEPVRKLEHDTDVAAAASLAGNRDWMATPVTSRLPQACTIAGGGVVTPALGLGRWNLLSGSTGQTIVLPTAVGVTGSLIGLKVVSSVTTVWWVTVVGFSSQAIDGDAAGVTLLRNNYLVLMSNGTTWDVVDSRLDTPWVNGGTIAPSAVTAAPTKGTTSVDRMWWRRRGDSAEFRYEYVQSTGGADGSGTYLIPFLFTADTAKINVTGAGVINQPRNVCGHGDVSGYIAAVSLYDSTRVYVHLEREGSHNNWASSYLGWNGANYAQLQFTLPIVGW